MHDIESPMQPLLVLALAVLEWDAVTSCYLLRTMCDLSLIYGHIRCVNDGLLSSIDSVFDDILILTREHMTRSRYRINLIEFFAPLVPQKQRKMRPVWRPTH